MAKSTRLMLSSLLLIGFFLFKGALGQPCPQNCPAVYDPVCSSDQQTFGNECTFQVSNCNRGNTSYILYFGECFVTTSTTSTTPSICSMGCIEIYRPVCGTNGQTYSNGCYLERDRLCNSMPNLAIAYNGECGATTTTTPLTTATDCPGRTCQAIYAPVCGSDGATYSNDCELGRIRDCTPRPNLYVAYPGECISTTTRQPTTPCPIVCTSIYRPVCGSDFRTYGNECELRKARDCGSMPDLFIAYNGSCTPTTTPADCPKTCPATYAPVCGSDGVTYPSECQLYATRDCVPRPNLYVAYRGECGSTTTRQPTTPCLLVCPAIYDPVCGSDGRTYSSACSLNIERVCGPRPNLYVAYSGECGSTTTRQPTTPCLLVCPAIYDPVCGSDGRTYSSACSLNIERVCGNRPNLYVAYTGECTSTTTATTPVCPIGCARIYQPVCGSDGRTYSNECELRRAKYCGSPPMPYLTVAYQGECTSTTTTPGCTINCPTDEYIPVCGSNGRTYSNLCELYRARDCGMPYLSLAYTGACTSTTTPPSGCTLICPEIHRPVCGSNGRTYFNECELNRARNCGYPGLYIVREGTCECDVLAFCTKEYAPVCGTDGKTYENNCTLSRAIDCNPSIRFRHFGECRRSCDEIACPFVIAPVCGSDGVTYDNECRLNGARECRNPRLKKVFDGPCTCRGPCPEYLSQVCGTDGKTYDNECFLIRANYCSPAVPITIKHYGKCTSGSSCDTPCANVFEPVCGSDGKLYLNECSMTCRGRGLSVRRRCANDWSEVPCARPDCHNEYRPVCGTDGLTYNNKCVLDFISYCRVHLPRLEMAYSGNCRPKDKRRKSAGNRETITTSLILSSLTFLAVFRNMG